MLQCIAFEINVNFDKCMVCKIQRTGNTGEIEYNNNEIKKVENSKYLGSKTVKNSRAQEEIKWMNEKKQKNLTS